ncbi:SusE domain-containing protein [Saccharicrinis fermentans]|uniref:SusE outer membrane protein domain-containing protein n=1 Tax=Saccharicrinis fermentans DSM 9555 = JCM 21142 TaxID=869213 RepID=W7YDF9_9BACT|nr:SusE domain-containing protein [Saccharicrinis fermentans]GAF02526.1 hypothetical protein JCM21142_31164 [Saccharicrinis fermentans DSM 9555 = JCM 21142]
MKNYYIILFALLGLLTLTTSCEKDGDEPIIRKTVIAPEILTMPDLELLRANGDNEVTFVCSPVDAGFNASVNYFLEACPEGDGFQNVIQVYKGTTCSQIVLTVSELNAILLDGFKEDVTSSADFRIRCELETDAGMGVSSLEYSSQTVTTDVTVFGLLRLDVIVAGATGTPQKIVTLASDGFYEGFVKLEAGDSFTLLDPDNNITYGVNGSSLAKDGAAIAVEDAGWYKISAHTVDLTFENLRYLVGIVGVVNDWSAPDLVMDYDIDGKYWYLNAVVLPNGGMKFRHNEDWSNDFNFGVVDNSVELDFTNISLVNAGDSQDILMDAGTYDIKLWIDLDGDSKCSIVSSNP